jgi:hypothetical protein
MQPPAARRIRYSQTEQLCRVEASHDSRRLPCEHVLRRVRRVFGSGSCRLKESRAGDHVTGGRAGETAARPDFRDVAGATRQTAERNPAARLQAAGESGRQPRPYSYAP